MDATHDLIKQLREQAECLKFDGSDQYTHGLLNQAADTIEELSANLAAVNSGWWIPCSERLPEECTDVLVCDSLFRMNVGHLIYKTFFDFDSGEISAIAWMPLPEPFKPNETD